ncbi:MAG TPA: hypothetical protein VME21_07955 [Steroidobacteraceae bacterium]|nr:hypothetical protein [Steroidobacteraceae bacterium]
MHKSDGTNGADDDRQDPPAPGQAPEQAPAPALDRALARALPPPAVPEGFRARLLAAIERDTPLGEARERLEREQRQRLAELEASYVRLRRRTLGTLIGGAFASGAAVTLALPWLQAVLGSSTPLALAGAGALIALLIGLASLRGVRIGV